MKEESRWEQAQGYEKNWWQNRASSVDFKFYKSFADELIKFTECENFLLAGLLKKPFS